MKRRRIRRFSELVRAGMALQGSGRSVGTAARTLAPYCSSDSEALLIARAAEIQVKHYKKLKLSSS